MALAATLGFPPSAWGLQPSPPALERVNLADGGKHYEGLVESEDDTWIYFIQIQRPTGRPTHLVVRTLDRRTVASVVRLDAPQRAMLRQQIEQFVNRAAIEAGRMEAVVLVPLQKEGNHYQHYAGKWFTLDSTAEPQTVRRVVVRVEQVFAAYRQMLAPRNRPARPPRLVVFDSMEQYQSLLAPRGLKILNRACFLEGDNLVAVGSELAHLNIRTARVNTQVELIQRELKELEKRLEMRRKELADAMREEGRSRSEIAGSLAMLQRQFDADVAHMRNDLQRYQRETAQTFENSTRQMFARIYHESFHAYLENYVYPHQKYDVPRWLNEGLAVMFEGGVLEAGSLRVDAPNAAALARLKADLDGPQPLALQQVLSTDPAAFLQLHDTASSASDRLYAYAWGLAYYLAFEKHLLDSPALEQYVAPAARQLGPVPRLERLVGMSLGKFEQDWREYIRVQKAAPQQVSRFPVSTAAASAN